MLLRDRLLVSALASLATIVLLAATPGCSADGEASGDATPATEDEITGNNVQKALEYGRALVGTQYGWWLGGPLPAGAPMWTANGPALPLGTVRSTSTNCAGLTNLMLRAAGKDVPSSARFGRGGTAAYAAYYAKVAQRFDVNANYPAGTLIGRRFRDVNDQGHVAVVLGNGNVLQSFANAFKSPNPGVTANVPLRISHGGGYYEYAVLPQDWLGGGGADNGGASGGTCRFGAGLYCGRNGVDGKTTNLYRCAGGKVTLVRECASGCVHEEAGTDDHCAEREMRCDHGNGLYCGENGVAGDAKVLYSCTDGKVEPEKFCANGCVAEKAGTNDHCR